MPNDIEIRSDVVIPTDFVMPSVLCAKGWGWPDA